jgi:hypothetical protein
MVAGRGRTAVAVAAVLGPGVDDFAETKAGGRGAPGGSVRATGRAASRRWGSRGGIDDRRELERACAAHVVDNPTSWAWLVLGS